MKRWMMAFGILLACSGLASADPTVVADPKGAVEKAGEVIKVLTPSADVIYGSDHDFYAGTSVDIVNLGKAHKALDLFQLRAGWAETQVMYSALSLDLEKLTGLKYAKYVHAGLALGYSWQDKDAIYGPILGVKVEL